jgi:hypothetical protein
MFSAHAETETATPLAVTPPPPPTKTVVPQVQSQPRAAAFVPPVQTEQPTVKSKSHKGLWIALAVVVAGAAVGVALLSHKGGEPASSTALYKTGVPVYTNVE